MSENEVGREAESDVVERVARIKGVPSAVDGQKIAENANRFSVAMMAVGRERPDLAEDAYPAIEAALSGIDFGKLREALTALSGYGVSGASKVLEDALASPVTVANLVGVLPPVANGLIELMSTVVDSLDLPPEILASAIFNILSALDAEKLGHVLSQTSRQLNLLHAGNYILGGDEPRLRAVFSDIMKRLLDNLDIEEVTDAVAATGEDAEVIAGTIVELTARDPAVVLPMITMLTSLGGSLTRILSSALNEVAAWPDELLEQIGGVVREGAEAAELGHALDSLTGLALRFREANPDLNRELLTDVIRAVNTEQLELVARGAINDFKYAAAQNSGIRMALEPEEMGRRINDMLAGFNRSAGTAAVSDYLSRLFGAIDHRELGAAINTVGGGLIDASFASARTAKSIIRAAASNAWKLIKNVAGLIAGR